MEESYIRGVNQEIIRYLKDIKSELQDIREKLADDNT